MAQEHRDFLLVILRGPVDGDALRDGLGARIIENAHNISAMFSPGECRFDIKEVSIVNFHKAHGGSGSRNKKARRPNQIARHVARSQGCEVADLIGLRNHPLGWDGPAWTALCARDWSPV
ncbi:uncharacterized protein BXZ73DRAFT_95935 [Epithele typhae]|uniref:uncharacterized protein n=1 Tax=Epithele typhae TaxID=378194 RepID=UPI002007B647|nr:uncharacterized protein BXZ73DRAFT_95935 [Epithele typhae]KAH9944942.1 hypothetical protein BXZ73DRAFT_95935 [Epithele typhae]